MPWTVIDDNGTYQVRAAIETGKEMDELIACLEAKRAEMSNAIKEKADER